MIYKIEKLNPQIVEIIKKHELQIPKSDLFITAYHNNEIKGVTSISNLTLIEPLIATNPVIANNLYQRAEALTQLTTDEVYVLTNSPNVEKLLQKLNYRKVLINVWRKKWD